MNNAILSGGGLLCPGLDLATFRYSGGQTQPISGHQSRDHGLLTVRGTELSGLLALLCLGKANRIYIRNKLVTWLKRLKPAAPVSRNRYRVGLIVVLLPIIPTYIMAYAPQLLPDHSRAPSR
jgi:hypothetical protein